MNVVSYIVWSALLVLALVIWSLTGPRGEIRDDAGGPIGARVAEIAAGPPVRITGRCASACTMHLHNGCVTPDAKLIFHGPRATGTAFDHWSAVMARHYPPLIAAWFMEVGRHGQYTMTGAQAIGLGATPC